MGFNEFRQGRVGLVIGLLLLMGCVEVEETIPRILHGTWTAAGSMYDGRSMVIGEDQIAFSDAQGRMVSHQVVGIYTERVEGETRYALDYSAPSGAEYRMHLLYNSSSGEMRLAGRRQVIWTREDS